MLFLYGMVRGVELSQLNKLVLLCFLFLLPACSLFGYDMNKQIAGMDARSYFNNVQKFERDYVDAVQIIKFDLMPGQTIYNKKIDIKSRFRAKGAYVIAKYQGNGNTKASVGKMPVVIVKCRKNGIEVLSAVSYAKKYNVDCR